jgi:hypothetical protein
MSLQGSGYRVQVMPKEEWREQHLQYVDTEGALFPVLPPYPGGEITDRNEAPLSKLFNVRNNATHLMLTQLEMSFPIIDQSLWRRYE